MTRNNGPMFATEIQNPKAFEGRRVYRTMTIRDTHPMPGVHGRYVFERYCESIEDALGFLGYDSRIECREHPDCDHEFRIDVVTLRIVEGRPCLVDYEEWDPDYVARITEQE